MNTKKKLLALATACTLIAGTSMTFATDITYDDTKKDIKKYQEFNKMEGSKYFRKAHHRGGRFSFSLSEQEKKDITTMSGEEKKAFFSAKQEAYKTMQTKKEIVIDKLLRKENLTNEEESIRETIIEERQKRKEHRKQLENLLKKNKSGEEFTDEEKTLFDRLKNKNHSYNIKKPISL